MGRVIAVCISEAKGTQKKNIHRAEFIEDWGIRNDAHAGKWHRQVSLLSHEKIEAFRARGAQVEDGAFGENLVVEGIDFSSLPVGTIFRCNDVVLELTQVGKKFHHGCEIFQKMGDCIMPREGVFTKVLHGGFISEGDEMTVEHKKNKILTFSYDDGVTQDVRLIELFHKYHMKATFNLNSGLLGQENELVRDGVRISHNKNKPEDVRFIYDGHEVAAHTLTHPLLTQIEDVQEIIRQVEEDRIKLSDLCGYEVIGMAYPGGGVNYNDHVSDVIRKHTGIRYARITCSSHSFDLQNHLYQFQPSVYHHTEMDRMFEMGREFLELKTDERKIFYVWGHAYEFDIRNEWKRFEEFLEMMSGREDIAYCTNREAFLL